VTGPSTNDTTPTPVTAHEIADLLAWGRSLAQRGAGANPVERDAFLAAKAQLLARITSQPHTGAQGGEG
jgi:hypothetical protein